MSDPLSLNAKYILILPLRKNLLGLKRKANNHFAFILIIIQKICSAHIFTLLGALGTNPETPGQVPSLSR